MEKVVDWYMDNMNYGTLTLLMTVESSFIPFPSEVVVPPAAYKARQPDSGMNLPLIVFFATLGALFGALFNYYLALWLGRPIIHKFAESRIGKMCLLSSEKVDRAEKYFDEHGKISTFIGRLVPVIRQLISLPAGLARMNIWIFMLYTTIGALIWNTVLTAIGAIAGDNKAHFEKYYTELSWVCVVAGILFIIYLVYNGFKKKR
ncbi:MAG: DedA family protein [Dysgonamonadaceae bacterium]|nr:DedA family protein [Dysgonamonadaceae bacterium]